MGLKFHPKSGCIVTVSFQPGFKEPEMIKRRPAIVLSPAIKARVGLLTIVSLSTTPPKFVMPYHYELDIPFELPRGWSNKCWVKGDMVNAIGFHRTDLLRIGKNKDGSRKYQTATLPDDEFRKVRQCVLHGLGMSRIVGSL